MVVVGAHFLRRSLGLEQFLLYVVKASDIHLLLGEANSEIYPLFFFLSWNALE